MNSKVEGLGFYPDHLSVERLEKIFHFSPTKRREFVRKLKPRSKEWASKFEEQFYSVLWEFLGNPYNWPRYNHIVSLIQNKRTPLTIRSAIIKFHIDFDREKRVSDAGDEPGELLSEAM